MLHLKNQIWQDLQNIRIQNPLVFNITNMVVINSTANALLAIGASPIMSHAQEEVQEIAASCSSLVLNMGTVDSLQLKSMKMAADSANEHQKPIVFDPVGSGFTAYRSRLALDLIASAQPNIIRGNAGEIISLTGTQVLMKGVDSLVKAEKAIGSLKELSRELKCVLCASGETDVVIEGDRMAYIGNGSVQATEVTGMGCIATAITGAFAAINPDAFTASAGAMAIMGVCEEIAYLTSVGPASFYVHFIDALNNLSEEDFYAKLRIQV